MDYCGICIADLFGFCAIIPIVSCITTAFKTDAEYQNTNVMAFPGSWLNFDNFVNAFKTANMGRAFLNSVIVMVVVLTVSVIVGSQLAYVLNRFKFPGNGFIRNLYTIAALLPAVAMQVTVYQIMSDLHLVNSLGGYIIMSCGTDVISMYISFSLWKIFRFHWMSRQLSMAQITGRFTGRLCFHC